MRRSSPWSAFLLSAAPLAAPALEPGGRGGELLAAIAASAVLSGFAALRLRRCAGRERTLSGARAALASATTRREIGTRAEAAARKLAGEQASVSICRAAVDGTAFVEGAGWPLPAYALAGLRAASRQPVTTLDEATCLALRLPLGRRRAVVHALGGLEGFIVVAGASVGRRAVREALHSLGSQVRLALETAPERPGDAGSGRSRLDERQRARSLEQLDEQRRTRGQQVEHGRAELGGGEHVHLAAQAEQDGTSRLIQAIDGELGIRGHV
jgi:hypothetical protein